MQVWQKSQKWRLLERFAMVTVFFACVCAPKYFQAKTLPDSL